MLKLRDEVAKCVLVEINEVYGALSPENLTHDGELPQHIVDREEKRLTKRLNELFKLLGREVSEEEAWRLSR